MTDNSQIPGGSGDFIRDIDKGGVKTQVVTFDVNGTGPEKLISDTNPLPVSDRVDFNYEKLSETNDLLRILIREFQSLRLGFARELPDMPEPETLEGSSTDVHFT